MALFLNNYVTVTGGAQAKSMMYFSCANTALRRFVC